MAYIKIQYNILVYIYMCGCRRNYTCIIMKFNTNYDDFMLHYYLVHKNELVDKDCGINMSIE